MDNDKFQALVLKKIELLDVIQTDVSEIKSNIAEIKTELRGAWDDILHLDKRLTAQAEELILIKRLR